jgi:hypothetical protein
VSAPAFTPGPWEAWISGKTICILGPTADHNKPVIGWPGFDSCHLPLTKQKANARLIAAAPDYDEFTAEALPQLEVLHSTLPKGEARVAVWRVILKGRAALAKARGEQP